MMLFNLVLLAIIQGITEFLPISSSAHLVLLHEAGGSTPDDLLLDVAVHLGSIVAVILYFWPDVRKALHGGLNLVRGRISDPGSRLARDLLVATLPAIALGAVIAASDWTGALRDIRVIGWMMILFGIVLWWVHRIAPETRSVETWSLKHALVMGLWQAVALVPGVSRSGITITAARGLGYERRAAARLSMLMSIPITLATGSLVALEFTAGRASGMPLLPIAIAATLAFVAAYAALSLMMRFLDRVSFTPYIVYRLLLGAVLLVIAYR